MYAVRIYHLFNFDKLIAVIKKTSPHKIICANFGSLACEFYFYIIFVCCVLTF